MRIKTKIESDERKRRKKKKRELTVPISTPCHADLQRRQRDVREEEDRKK